MTGRIAVRRYLRVMTTLVLVLGIFASDVVDRSEPAEAVGVSTLDWNAAGNYLGEGKPLWLYEHLRPSIEARGSGLWVVTLQEVCRSQTDYLYRYYLEARGWGWASFQSARNGGDPYVCQGGQFGNAVFMRGGGPTWEIDFSAQNQINGVNTVEKRGMACEIGNSVALLVCSVHAHTDIRWADCQLAEAWNYFQDYWYQGYRVLVGADVNISIGTDEDGPPRYGFNQCPHYPQPQTSLEWIYARYYESDQPVWPSDRSTHNTRGKIDAVFVNARGYFYADLWITSSASDHRLLTAYVAW